jgi:hypothetical protein
VRRTAYNNVRAARALAPAAARVTGTATGLTVDRFVNDVFYNSVTFAIHTGTVTDGTHTVNVEDSADGTAWAAAAAGDLQGTAPAISTANANAVFEVGYVGAKRYVRCNLVTTGATTGGFVDAVAVLGVQAVKRP